MKLRSIGFYFLFLIELFLGFGDLSYSKSDESQKIKTILEKYWAIQKEFSQKVCQGADLEYKKLYEKYQSAGIYIPYIETENGEEIDIDAIKENLPLFEKKIEWQNQLMRESEKLMTQDWEDRIKSKMNQIEKSLIDLSLLKEEAERREKKGLLNSYPKVIIAIKGHYQDLVNDLKIWGNFVETDYFTLRLNYEEEKEKGVGSSKKVNEIYLQRKIIEDGMASWGDQDLHFRALLRTIAIRLEKAQNDLPLSDDLFYDLKRILKWIPKRVLIGRSSILKSLNDWNLKNKTTYETYKAIIADVKRIDYLKNARKKLIDFNYEKQMDVYQFWIGKEEVFKYLYVHDIILYSEIGPFEIGSSSYERDSVSKLIINRFHLDQYNKLSEIDPLYKKLSNLFRKEFEQGQDKMKWLNLLFKKGEFSFTYFYIPSSTMVYCPDRSKRGLRIRQENVKMALKNFFSKDASFKGVRFFSRRSMVGGIDISTIWKNHRVLDEKIGNKVKGKLSHTLLKILKNEEKKAIYLRKSHLGEKIFYLYDFIEKGPFWVLFKKSTTEFYDYRDPHAFQYFEALGH